MAQENVFRIKDQEIHLTEENFSNVSCRCCSLFASFVSYNIVCFFLIQRLVRESTQHCGPLLLCQHFDNNQKLTDAMLVGLFVVVSGSHVCGRVRHHGGLCFGAAPPRSEHQAAVAAASPRPLGELKKSS